MATDALTINIEFVTANLPDGAVDGLVVKAVTPAGAVHRFWYPTSACDEIAARIADLIELT